MMQDLTNIVAGNKVWNRYDFNALNINYPGKWLFVSDEYELLEALERESHCYVFFLHWNWRVSAEIWSWFECVCFHMTDVPYGRGVKHSRNLIIAGHERTMVSALRMLEEMDAGPVYAKLPMTLAGRVEEIYARAGTVCIDIIGWFIDAEPLPEPQLSEPVLFKWRNPSQSELPFSGKVRNIYNHIRMLDAPSYPVAFFDYGGFRLEFLNIQLSGYEVVTLVVIKLRQEKD